MPTPPNLNKAPPPLEQPSPETSTATFSQPPSSRRPLGLGFMVIVLVLIGMLTANSMLLSRQVAALRDTSIQTLFWDVCEPTASAERRAAAFTELVARNHREWRSAQLFGLPLAGVDLTGADLSKARLIDCNLQDADLSNTDLSNASLELSQMNGAIFDKARLIEVNLFKSKLDDASFRNADLTGASIAQASAHNARFILTEMAEMDLQMADLTDAQLTGANLTGANLSGVNFRGADLSLARFNDAHLADADFTGSNWWRARGFTTSQLAECITKFAPTEAVGEKRLNDYRLWLQQHAAQPD